MTWVALDDVTPLRAGWYAAITRWKTDSGRIPAACWWSGTKWGVSDPDRIVCFLPAPFEDPHAAASMAFDLEDAGREPSPEAEAPRPTLAAAAG